MSQNIVAAGYVIESSDDSDMLSVRVGEYHAVAAAIAMPDVDPDQIRWRVVLFAGKDTTTIGATVHDRDEAIEWLHRLGQLHAKAAS